MTAIECVSAAEQALDPMIIWPASTHRANWTTHPTPGWHYAYSDSGYTDSYLSLQWLKCVFNPQTEARANRKPRILICDGFGSHETLEILEFCFENNIVLCRLPSHSSHKLQPCDISLFGPLKSAYRDQAERLDRGGVGTIGKEHFTCLYSPARKAALTARNIRAGWTKAGLFPFDPARVLRDLPKPVEQQAPAAVGREVSRGSAQSVPPTPVTPRSVSAVASLHDLIRQDTHSTDEESKQRLQKCVQKLANASKLCFAERGLLQERNKFLADINNEGRARRSTKAQIVGTARVMSYEDLQRARVERAAKDAANEARKQERRGRRKRTSAAATKTIEQQAETHVSTTNEMQSEGSEYQITSDLYRAPVARMW